MDEKTSGLILRLRPLTETSLIVNWLTPDLGRISTVAKGARRPKSPYRGKLDLFYLADFSFQRSRRSELHNLREVVLRETHSELRKEIGYVQQASYCAALIEQTTETETPLGNLFSLMTNFLTILVSHPPQPLSTLAFEMKLLDELGLKPELLEPKVSAGSKQILNKMLELDWEQLSRLKLSTAQLHEIQQFLRDFILQNVGRVPKGRPA